MERVLFLAQTGVDRHDRLPRPVLQPTLLHLDLTAALRRKSPVLTRAVSTVDDDGVYCIGYFIEGQHVKVFLSNGRQYSGLKSGIERIETDPPAVVIKGRRYEVHDVRQPELPDASDSVQNDQFEGDNQGLVNVKKGLALKYNKHCASFITCLSGWLTTSEFSLASGVRCCNLHKK